jgi:hypothetical protein
MEDEIGWACGTYGGEEMRTGFEWGNLKERIHFKDLCGGGRIILKWIV